MKEQGGIEETDTGTEPVTPQAALDGLGPWMNRMQEDNAGKADPEWETALIRLLHIENYGDAARRVLA